MRILGIDCGTEHTGYGLIDSDGCRVVANDRGVRSVRHHFSNRSDDIRGLFCAALDQLGIPWILKCSFDKANRQSSAHYYCYLHLADYLCRRGLAVR